MELTEERKKEIATANYRNHVLGQMLQILTKEQFCKFVANLTKAMDEYKYSPGEMLDAVLDNGKEAIMAAFPWMGSNEGHDYWSKIDDKFQKHYKPYNHE